MSMLIRNLKQVEESRLARQKSRDRAAQDAEAEQVARERIGANSSRLDELKANELAEAEILALARIRAQSERTLVAQAEALRDAERKLELTTIDRRSTDLEAAREANNRAAADVAAREAAEKRADAEREAAQAARQRAEAAAEATAAAEARYKAEVKQKSATAARRRAQWAAFWAGARFKPVASVGAVMLALGVGGGVWLSGHLPRLAWAPAELPEPRLRIDDSVESVAQRAAALPPPREIRPRGRNR
ncbi:MAG: hypothetical protein Q8O25_06180 [Sulfurisoma sp.]|nr:hypothetical protein [Sulfurisoma sp.]